MRHNPDKIKNYLFFIKTEIAKTHGNIVDYNNL